ncbi:hypothetical protein TNCV_2258451, partial [Trichonephila clavipes]
GLGSNSGEDMGFVMHSASRHGGTLSSRRAAKSAREG